MSLGELQISLPNHILYDDIISVIALFINNSQIEQEKYIKYLGIFPWLKLTLEKSQRCIDMISKIRNFVGLYIYLNNYTIPSFIHIWRTLYQFGVIHINLILIP